MTRGSLLVLASFAIAACASDGTKAALNAPTIDTLPGGVVRVNNTGPSMWDDTTSFRLVEDAVIAPPEGSPGELSDINAVVADARGIVYVFQQKPALIRVYGPDGEWMRDIGREGDGPGEYRQGMFGIHRDTLFIQDPNNTRLTTFLTSGEFISSHTSQCCWWTSNFPVFDDGTVGIPGPPPANASDRPGALYLTRLDGTVSDTVLMPIRNNDDSRMWKVEMKSGKNSSMMAMGIPLQPSNSFAYLPNRRRVEGNTATYSLAIIDLDGDTSRVFTAPAQSLGVSDSERDSIFEATVEGVGAQWRDAMRAVAKKTDIPMTWPAWTEAMVDDRSRIWVGRPGARGPLSTLDVFSSDGVLLGSVTPPTGFKLRGSWAGGKFYQISESEDGLPQVTVWRIDSKVRGAAEGEGAVLSTSN
ncbi:MAG: hypothetical protein H0W15_08335 [Gemmatimonadales bacterium]|nr:hypothetical protein [Gemmatimonadales bacterium]